MILMAAASESIKSQKLIWKTLEQASAEAEISPQTIIHAGHSAADECIPAYARVKVIPTEIFRPDYRGNPGSGREAFFINASEMFNRADVILFIWDGSSAVTAELVTRAFATGKRVMVYCPSAQGKAARLSLLQIGKKLREIDERRINRQRQSFSACRAADR